MIHTKRVIFMILPLLFVPLVYGMSSTPDACAAPMDPLYWTTADCIGAEPKHGYGTCCWEKDKQKYCQACKTDGYTVTCGPVQGPIGFEQPPTPPVFDPTAPMQGGVLQQLPDQPPLFGRNEAAVPPTGGIEQPFTTTTPPLFGNVPQGGGFGILQEPETPPMFGQVSPLVQKPTTETPPTPLPTPPPPDFTPQDNQDDNQGGGLPTTESNKVPSLDDEITSEDDGQQEDSSEGAETPGPLT